MCLTQNNFLYGSLELGKTLVNNVATEELVTCQRIRRWAVGVAVPVGYVAS